MSSYTERLGRKVERDTAAYERENQQLQSIGVRGPNASADAAASMVLDRQYETAREAVRDAKDELARLRREHAHRDDIAEARDVLSDARADLAELR